MTESGGLVNPVNEIRKVANTVGDVDGGASSGLRRSSRAKSSWTPFRKEDCCARRRALGELSRSSGLQELPTQGCYCPEECTGFDNGGCGNRVPVFSTENWVHMTKGRGLDPSPQSLRAKRDIPAGTLMTLFGGVVLQAWTQKEEYEAFTKLHVYQHDTVGEEKFQYSVLVGSEQDEREGHHPSLAWLVPVNDFALLHRILSKKSRTNKSDRKLKTLTVESRASIGLGQYAQHTCCSTHSNSHLFPVFVSREEETADGIRDGREGDWMQLQGVALRADRLIRQGEAISFGYVGSGRSGHFEKVFACACCWCTGRCNKGTHKQEQAWLDVLDQIEVEQPLQGLREMERQIVIDKGSLPGLRRAFPGSSERTRPGRKVTTEMSAVWEGSGMKLQLKELYDIGNMTGWLSGLVINELLAWILNGKTAAAGLSPHQREGVAMWSTQQWDTLSRACDRYTKDPSTDGWKKFKAEIRQDPAFQLPEGRRTGMVCCPVHYKSHWLWVLLLLDERVGIILDPLVSHTGRKGHEEILGKIWLWREAVLTNDTAPRSSPPLTISLEEGRRRRVADILEMGGSWGGLATTKAAWVTNIWKVPQQRDGSACGVYVLATAIALTRGWSLQDSTSAEQSWVRKARAWLLQVTLANTARAPLGPCARCEGVELNTVVRAGARMCLFCTHSTAGNDTIEVDHSPPRPRLPRRAPSTRELLASEGAIPGQGWGDCTTARLEFSPSSMEGTCTSARAERGVAPEIDTRGSDISLNECQDATNVMGRARDAQQRVRQSRMTGWRGNGEGAQRASPHPLSSGPLGEGQLCDTEEITERKFRAGGSGVTRDEEMGPAENVVSDPQERQNERTQGAGPEEDGTLPLSRQSQSSRRVTFALWVEGTGTEAEEGHTKTTVTKSERSLQCMEDASAAKQTWTQHLQEEEEAGGLDRGLEQDLQQIRDRDRGQTLLSLLTRTSKGRTITRGDAGISFMREGSGSET
jgi:hypothetical protein